MSTDIVSLTEMLAYPEPVPPGGVVHEMLPQHHQQAGGHRPAHPQVPAQPVVSIQNDLFQIRIQRKVPDSNQDPTPII